MSDTEALEQWLEIGYGGGLPKVNVVALRSLAKEQLASLLARLEKAEGERDRLVDCYARYETILPDGELGVTVLDLVEQLEKAEKRVEELEAILDGSLSGWRD